MDLAEFQLMQEAEDMEDAAKADLYNTQLSAALLIMGAEESQVLHSECQNLTRSYLCHPQLQQYPQNTSSWQALFNSQNDRAFITTMGFDVKTFELIVRSGFGTLWLSQPIPRADASTHGEPRPGGRSLDAWGALGLVLHYLNSTMLEISLQQIFALIPTTVSRYINFGLEILLKTLHSLPDAAIQWPVQDIEK